MQAKTESLVNQYDNNMDEKKQIIGVYIKLIANDNKYTIVRDPNKLKETYNDLILINPYMEHIIPTLYKDMNKFRY